MQLSSDKLLNVLCFAVFLYFVLKDCCVGFYPSDYARNIIHDISNHLVLCVCVSICSDYSFRFSDSSLSGIHPKICSGFDELNKAYNILSDQQKRERYDEKLLVIHTALDKTNSQSKVIMVDIHGP